MLRNVFSIVLLMLCTSALAESYDAAKNTLPSSVSAIVEVDSGFPESPDIALSLSYLHSSYAPVYILLGRTPRSSFHRHEQGAVANAPIRAPPTTL